MSERSINDILDEQGELLAQVYEMDKFETTIFPTPDECSFQFGFGAIPRAKELEAHMHKDFNREIPNTAEFIFVLSGQVDIDVISRDEVLIRSVELTSNMAILQFNGGHKIRIHDNTRYFELKQGPYLGKDKDKYTLEGY